MKIIDTYNQILGLYEKGNFNYEKWETYINSIYENSAFMFIDDMNRCIATGKYTFAGNYLPILNEVYRNAEARESAYNSFDTVVNGLNEKIVGASGKVWMLTLSYISDCVMQQAG